MRLIAYTPFLRTENLLIGTLVNTFFSSHSLDHLCGRVGIVWASPHKRLHVESWWFAYTWPPGETCRPVSWLPPTKNGYRQTLGKMLRISLPMSKKKGCFAELFSPNYEAFHPIWFNANQIQFMNFERVSCSTVFLRGTFEWRRHVWMTNLRVKSILVTFESKWNSTKVY